MIKVSLTELYQMNDNMFLCAVIVPRYEGKWVFVRQKGKKTWELPGGTHEINETITETAERELFEETGAKKFRLFPICISSVNINNRKSYGLLFYSEISELGQLPNSEIEELKLFEELPENLTYPSIHNILFNKAVEFSGHIKTN
ncbi:DNA mismatch repair protein MutT [Clostridium zeae]|uniref:DNA mismatch repair protein MutT n=1 Tax=Clostridium zeae TaxID=2759022 RepID=A0ABQ1E5L3_9CLOT|nr:NUDIX domain-containing protein [Clostridium zeae]GFZ30013.1 DNA mismatch repair protein MutT [Clostridium zeae]